MAVNSSELFVEQIGRQSFLSPWCYPNLYYKSGGNIKEFADLAIIFENTIILFSDKNISFDISAQTSIAWKRWYKRSVSKSVDQLLGACRQLRIGNRDLYMDAKLQSKFAGRLPPIDQLDLHLVALNHNVGGLSEHSELKTKSGLANDQTPFEVGCLFDEEFIHIVEGHALYTILACLNTIRDFIDFLKDRRCTLSTTPCVIDGNESFLGAYLKSQTAPGRYSVSRQIVADNRRVVLFRDGLWAEYAKSAAWQHTVDQNEQSYLIDKLVEHFAEEHLAGRLFGSENQPFAYHQQGWAMLARESRFSRRMLAQAFHSIIEEPDETTFWTSSVSSVDYPDTRYVFLTYPRPENVVVYEDFEQSVTLHLLEHMYAAGSAFKNSRFIIGIGLPNYQQGQHTVVLKILDKRTWSDEDYQTAGKFLKRLGVFKSVHAETTFHSD